MAEARSPYFLKQAERIPATAVIGGGVVGAAVTEHLARSGRPVVLFERAPRPGTLTSSHNSEVVHSGIYYPPGSNKALLSVAGRHMLYDYSGKNEIANRRAGKLVVAVTENEEAKLQEIRKRANANGVRDLAWLTTEQVKEMEPAVKAVSALHSPSTGIIDSEGLIVSLLKNADRNGAQIAVANSVTFGKVEKDGIDLIVNGDAFKFDAVVNSAGYNAQAVARNIEGVPNYSIPETYYAKGHYYSLGGIPPFTRLIYPVPVPGGLGIHSTVDLGGSVRFGPDVEYVDSPDYSFTDDPARKERFVTAIRLYYPRLDAGELNIVGTGIRPKTTKKGEQDFLILGQKDHGLDNYVGLHGVDSPGLTSALAIGRVVGDMLSNPGLTAAQAATELLTELRIGV